MSGFRGSTMPIFTFVKTKKDHSSLYFIALIPPEPLQTQLMELKQWVFDEVGSKGALRSPAHITLLMPFQWKPAKEKLLFNSLKALAATLTPFEVNLHNFNCFAPRVIYVEVEKSAELISIKNEVLKTAKQELKLSFLKDLRGFNPHITIGFRDLKKNQFYQAWEQVKNKPFRATFRINALVLLKHNGKHWEEYQSFELH